MNGHHFVKTLKTINYPKASKLDPDGWDWLFEVDDDLRPFMEWLCTSLDRDNVLSKNELKSYALLDASEIRDGQQLKEALDILSLDTNDEEDDDTIKCELEYIEKQIKSEQKSLDVLQHQKESLRTNLSSLKKKDLALENVVKKNDQLYTKTMSQCIGDNKDVNTALENIGHSIKSITELYKDCSNNITNQDDDTAKFLSQLELEDYNNAEHKFSENLTTFTKTLFFDGMSRLSGEGDGKKYDYLDINNPDNMLIRGQDEVEYKETCLELSRLQKLYHKSEHNGIKALLENAKLQNVSDMLKDKIEKLKVLRVPTDSSLSSKKQEAVQKSIYSLRKEAASLALNDIPELIKQSSESQISGILCGDYDLKLTRQDYFISNQDKVIEQLVNQRSRYEFMTMAYEVEARQHRDMHRLLTAIYLDLQKTYTNYQSRMKIFENPVFEKEKKNSGILDSRDYFMSSLYDIISRGSETTKEKKLYLTTKDLETASLQLQERLSHDKTCKENDEEIRNKQLIRVADKIDKLYERNLTGATTKHGLPSLGHPELRDMMCQVEDLCHKVERSLLDSIKLKEDRRRILKNDPLQAIERDLFVHFYNDPDKLQHVVDDITTKAKSKCDALF